MFILKKILFALVGLAIIIAGCGRGDPLPSDPTARAADARGALEKILVTQIPFLAWFSFGGAAEWHILTGGDLAFAGDPTADDQPEAFGALSDISLDIDPENFIKAGLDIDSLYMDPSGRWSPGRDALFGQKLRINVNFGAEPYAGLILPEDDLYKDGVEKIILAIFDGILKNHPQRLLADPARNLYGLDLGQGDSLWWTRNRAGTKKDFIIRLNPAPYVAAGMDPSEYLGWDRVKPDGKKAEPGDPAMVLEHTEDSFDK